jgi:AcrR family transcriptional regulator
MVAERARPKRTRADETVGRDKVLLTALQLFMRNGYDGTSLKSIANELDISAPALYWYFPSKDEIFASVMEMSLADFWSAVKNALTEEDPVLRLGQLVRAHVAWQLNQSDVARTFDVGVGMRQLLPALPEARAKEIIALEREYLTELRTILTNGEQRGQFSFADVKVTAFAITTMCEYVHTWFDPDGQLSIEDLAERYENLVLAMVGA